MEGKRSKMGHPRQRIRERIGGETFKIRNFMEFEIDQTRGRQKELRECGNSSSGRMQVRRRKPHRKELGSVNDTLS